MTSLRVAVVVPMKSLAQAKQRLRPAIDDSARQELAKDMLRHVLAAITASNAAAVAGVVTSDPEVRGLAAELGFAIIPESGSGYNDAVVQASAWAADREADCLIILPGDLPQLAAEDVHTLIAAAANQRRSAVIAPDRHQAGTNALVLRPPDLFAPSFGPNSFARHCDLARATGVEPVIVHSPGLAHDIDRPEDLHYLVAAAASPTAP